MAETFSAELDRVPEEAQNKACICEKCVSESKNKWPFKNPPNAASKEESLTNLFKFIKNSIKSIRNSLEFRCSIIHYSGGKIK
jgi:hypothetical protein